MSELQSTTLKLTLDDYWPPNANKTGGHHWSSLKKEKDKAFHHVMAAYMNTSPRVVFEGPVKVLVRREWGQRQRAMDDDNLWGAAKFLLDAIRAGNQNETRRRLEIIQDDDPDNITLKVEQQAGEKPKGEPRKLRTVIEITGQARDAVPE